MPALLLLLAVLLACWPPPAAAQARPAAAAEGVLISPIEVREGERERSIVLPNGKARIIRLPVDTRDVLVANPTVADVVLRTPRTVYLLGRQIGDTNAFFFDAEGREILRVEVRVELDVSSVQRALKDLLPESDVRVTAVNQNLFLTGAVRTPAMSENARQVARRFVEGDSNVVNLLQVVEDQQVLLQVRVAEVQRNVLKELGVTFRDSLGALNQTDSVLTGAPNPATPPTLSTVTSENFSLVGASIAGFVQQPFGTASFAFNRGTNDILTLTVNALERNGLIKTLAEPNLTAVSGETANFLAGGEFPVPAPDNDGNITIVFRSFGIALNFTPVVLNSGRISMRISTEVSALSNNGAITLQSISVPALSVRRAESTVELPSGGSLIIAGLLQDDMTTEIQGIPGLKDLPILGPFFRNNVLQKRESELIVAVRCVLVRPVRADQVRLPTDGFAGPSDYDLFFLGRLNAVYEKAPPPAGPSGTVQGPIGYIVE